MTILTTVTLESANNVLPDDGVTAQIHVGAVLMQILILFLRKLLLHQLVNKKILSSCIIYCDMLQRLQKSYYQGA